MISNDSTIKVETKARTKWQITFNTSRIYIKLYHTCQLLYCKGHIQMSSNDSIINVVTKNYIMNKMTKLYSIHSEFTLQACHTYHLLYFNGHIEMTSN